MMKKLIVLIIMVSASVFVLKSTVSANNGEKGDCATYCPYNGGGCILVYSNGAHVTCPDVWSTKKE